MGLIKYRDIDYGGGLDVTPNPSETATTNLEKIKIDSTTYAIKDTNAIHESDVGVAGGVAELDNNGKIPDSQLPDYGDNVDLSIVNGAIASTYDDDGTEVTEDIMQDETGDEIATVLDSIAETIQLLGQPEVYAPVVYSLEEREIGVWTDGKPLYQITVTNNSGISSVDQWLEIADIGNTKNIIDVDGKIITPVGEVPFNYNGEGSNISYITNMSASVVKALGKITARLSNVANWLRNNPIVMSIQYTKTTDVAGSGNYAALGVPAVHYDDTERVIGTWFGETLYRRTITGLSLALNGANWVNCTAVSNIKKLIHLDAYYENTDGRLLHCSIAEFQSLVNGGLQLCATSSSFNRTINVMTIEYTKTS